MSTVIQAHSEIMTERLRALITTVVAVAVLTGCAATTHPDFQNVYYKYNVPSELKAAIGQQFSRFGLANASFTSDRLGRIRLTGSYTDEDEIDKAFLIVQSIVGTKATSPVYPEDIKNKRWEQEASSALAEFFRRKAVAGNQAGVPTDHLPGQKYALIIGISKFRDARIPHLSGSEDAEAMRQLLVAKAGFQDRNVTSLVDERATKSNIISAIQQIKTKVRPNDSIVVFISSHGTPTVPDHTSASDENVRKMSIVAYDSDMQSPISLQQSAVSDSQLIQLTGSVAKSVVIILDTCYSGDVFSGLPGFTLGGERSVAFIRQMNSGSLDNDGYSKETLAKRWIGAKDITFAASVGSKDIGYSAGQEAAGTYTAEPASAGLKRNGIILITASSPGEKSYSFKGGERLPSGKTVSEGSFFAQSFVDTIYLRSGEVFPAFSQSRDFVVTNLKAQGFSQTPVLVRTQTAISNLYR